MRTTPRRHLPASHEELITHCRTAPPGTSPGACERDADNDLVGEAGPARWVVDATVVVARAPSHHARLEEGVESSGAAAVS